MHLSGAAEYVQRFYEDGAAGYVAADGSTNLGSLLSPFLVLAITCTTPSTALTIPHGKQPYRWLENFSLLRVFPTLDINGGPVQGYYRPEPQLPLRDSLAPGNLQDFGQPPLSSRSFRLQDLFGDCRSMRPPLTVEERKLPISKGKVSSFIPPPFKCHSVPKGPKLFQLVINHVPADTTAPTKASIKSAVTQDLEPLKNWQAGDPIIKPQGLEELFWVSSTSQGRLSLSGTLHWVHPGSADAPEPTLHSKPYRLGDGPFAITQINAYAALTPTSDPHGPHDFIAQASRVAAEPENTLYWAHKSPARFMRLWMERVWFSPLDSDLFVAQYYVPWFGTKVSQDVYDFDKHTEVAAAAAGSEEA
ncbi:MAG: hypothetical protein M1829_006047 [Trizodia sp. TS-e1964]|nr:MAG: hypothetical protein M1829_006047 [Trizodia sp. TS-e1964]